MTNEDLIRLINVNKFTPERCNDINNDLTIYEDLFDMYVQPKINYPNFLDGIDKTKIKLINVL